MCGIVGYVCPKNATTIILDGLKRLEYRGYDSAGVAVLENGEIAVRRDAGKLENLQNDWQTACLRAGIPYQALPRKNVTQYNNYRDFFDRDSVQLVAQHWAREIKELDYDFDKVP